MFLVIFLVHTFFLLGSRNLYLFVVAVLRKIKWIPFLFFPPPLLTTRFCSSAIGGAVCAEESAGTCMLLYLFNPCIGLGIFVLQGHVMLYL